MPAPANADEFCCEGLVPVGAADSSDNAWVRIRATGRGIDLVRTHIAELREHARKAEAALKAANERCRDFEKRAERADWTASELRRSEFEWEDTIPIDELGGERVLVSVRGTQGGIGKIKAFIERQEKKRKELCDGWWLAAKHCDAAEAKVAALEAEKAEALANIAGFEVLPMDATTYTVSCGDATMTVTGSPSGVANVVKLAYGGFEYGVSA